MDDAGPGSEKEYPCLIRVTDGKKANFSTHVSFSLLSHSSSSSPPSPSIHSLLSPPFLRLVVTITIT